jgi:hypothetical protein
MSLVSRATLVERGGLLRAIPRRRSSACSSGLSRSSRGPSSPGDTLFESALRALTIIADFGEPEAAVEILSRHVEDVERHVVAPKFIGAFYIYRWTGCCRRRWKVWDEEEEGRLCGGGQGADGASDTEPARSTNAGLGCHRK